MEMGIRNSDRLRTVWTAEMDRYFIDLMLEQVGKGSMIDDHLFSKRAWKHMTTLFNTRFNFHYEKDVLKNRHKTLRNLYKAVNNLLSLNGFIWDHTRQMVTADNETWDDYIKVCPDARSYRIKTIPYYHDLCQIYNTNTSTKGNVDENLECGESGGDADLENLHEIIINEECEEEMMTYVRGRTYWQPPMDRYLIDLMVDQVHKGNQAEEGLFCKQAWREMINSFNGRFSFKYDVDILKNRYKTFKRQYNVINKLLESQGFSWDDSRQMVIADDRAWQDYIEGNSDARQYMTRPVPYYKDLCIICKGVNLNQNDEEATFTDLLSDDLIEGCSHKRRLEEKEIQKEKGSSVKKVKMDMVNGLHEMAAAVSCLADKMKDEEAIVVENVIEAVQRLPDMDDDLILDACDFLEDDKKAKTFLALDFKLRKKWLIRKLRPPT